MWSAKKKKTLAYLLVLPGSRARIVRCGGRYDPQLVKRSSEWVSEWSARYPDLSWAAECCYINADAADKVVQRDICGRDQRDVVFCDLHVFFCDLRTCSPSRRSGHRRLVRRGSAANLCHTSCSPACSTSTIRHHDGTHLSADHWLTTVLSTSQQQQQIYFQ